MKDPFRAHAANSIRYDFPLRDATRLSLRLEVLDQQLKYAQGSRGLERNWGTERKRTVAHAILGALDLVFREDLRAQLLKEIYHLRRNYENLRARDDIRQEGLASVLAELEEFREELVQLKSNEVRTLRFDPLLSALRQRDSLTDAAMAVDLPVYKWWLNAHHERCRDDFRRWTETFQPLMDANRKFLDLLRQRGEYRDCQASQGAFTASITRGHELWMVRIAVPADTPCYPQVSGASDSGKIHLRFFNTPSGKEAAEPYRSDFSFQLAVC